MNNNLFQKMQIFHIIIKIIIVLMCLLGSIISHGQNNTQKIITENDYQKWGKLTNHTISEKGNWVSYAMQYDETPDTLFIKNINKNKRFKFSDVNKGEFINEKLFIFLDKQKTLNCIDLFSGNNNKVKNVKNYAISKNHQFIITIENSGNKNYLTIRNYKTNIVEQIEGIDEFKINDTQDELVAYKQNESVKSVILISLVASITKSIIIEENDVTFSKFVWSDSYKSIAFLAEYKNNDNTILLYHYDLNQKKLNLLNPKEIENFPSKFKISNRHNNITISLDDQRVIFGIIKNLKTQSNENNVQIWKSNDPIVYSEKKHLGELDYDFKLAVWWPQKGKFSKITENEKPYAILNNTKDYALTFSFGDTPPQYTMNRNVNYYVKNIETNEEVLLVNNQPTGLHNSSMSPKGKYFAYFNNKEWWVYNFKEKKKIQIPIPKNIDFSKIDYANEKGNFGVAGWCQNEEYIILYDQYDIWKAPLNGSNPIRITKGREQNITFKIGSNKEKKYFIASGNNDPIINLQEEIILTATTKNKTGYFILKPSGVLKEICFDNLSNSKISKASKASKAIFITQNYNIPPKLIFTNLLTNKKLLCYQSNIHHFNYQWHKQEIITYKKSNNEELNGILYYPNQYNPNQIYPMVVFIYEEQFAQKNNYSNPSMYSMTGFNIATFTAQGYFVLMPDIKYEIGNPGPSALDCVLAATNKVINSGKVNKNKIALMGQSFGGYETNFIITQTNIFKTAISGVSIFDTNRMYQSLSESSGKPEMWRFESQQWRMGKQLFDDRKSYDTNSPSNYVENVSTPVLLWCGEADKQINPDQSIAMYLALRRLNKECILLMYPKESHSIILNSNQRDLYSKIKAWLAYHLKDELPAEWIKNED